MKSNGTAVAAVLFAVLAAYFAYQWWFNPTRAVQRRLNDIAAALSIPDGEPPMARLERAAQLRRYLAEDLQLRAGDGEAISREAALAAVAAFPPPPGGWNIQFVDVRIRVDPSTAASADAFFTIEINGRDSRTGQPTMDSRPLAVTLVKHDREWLVTSGTANPFGAGGPDR